MIPMLIAFMAATVLLPQSNFLITFFIWKLTVLGDIFRIFPIPHDDFPRATHKIHSFSLSERPGGSLTFSRACVIVHLARRHGRDVAICRASTVAKGVAVTVDRGRAAEMGVEDPRPFWKEASLDEVDHPLH